MKSIKERIDFDRIYENFDLGDYLLQPIGDFSREDLRLILESITNVRGIATLSKVMGLRTMMSNELIVLKNDSAWKIKSHYIKDEEAVEMFVRLYVVDLLEKWCNQNE